MHSGRFVFSQLMDHLPSKAFRRCVRRYHGDRRVQSFTCLDQFLCMAFAQLTLRESLRDIEVCLRAHRDKLYHMGIRGGMSRNTLSNANMRRDWRIYADFAQSLIDVARPLYADDDLGLDLDNTVYALDSSTIDLCLSLFPWALFRATKSGVKLHTLLDLRGSIPAFMHVSEARPHDVGVLDALVPEPGAFYVMDRAYLDFARLFRLHSLKAFFVTRAKSNTRCARRYSRPVDKSASSGSSSTFESSPSSAPPRTRSRRKSGSPCPSMCSSPSSGSGTGSTPTSTLFCRSSASPCSKKHRSFNYLPAARTEPSFRLPLSN